LIIDYGLFRAFTFDFVQDLPRWFRALLLGGALAAVCIIVEIGKSLRAALQSVRERAEAVSRRRVREEGVVKELVERVRPKLLEPGWLMTTVVPPVAILYFAAWIGLGLWLDRHSVNTWAIGLLVCTLLAGLVALVIVKRLMYEFRDAALALVLERRFPRLLG